MWSLEEHSGNMRSAGSKWTSSDKVAGENRPTRTQETPFCEEIPRFDIDTTAAKQDVDTTVA